MIVCSCNVFSDKEVKGCLSPGPGCPRTPAQVYRYLGYSPQCGRCVPTIRSLLAQDPPREDGICLKGCCDPKAEKQPRWRKAGSLAANAPLPAKAVNGRRFSTALD